MTKAPYKGRFAKRGRKKEGGERKIVVRVAGLEPATYRLKGDYSTTELHALIKGAGWISRLPPSYSY